MSDRIERYLACWNETGGEARRSLIEDVWSADAEYVDPFVEIRGHAAIDATIGAAQQQFAGLTFSQSDSHHQLTRFRWGLGPAGAEPIVIGFDAVVTGGDGRIRSVLGFLDTVPDPA